jgi:3-oxoacyl-[acyl-carrier-protein] synthase II
MNANHSNGAQRSAGRRVAVTGLGLSTSKMQGVEGFRRVLLGEGAALAEANLAADAELLARFPQLKPKYLDETAKYALLAAAEALDSGKLLSAREQGNPAWSDDIGLALGTLSGPIKWGFEHGFIEAMAESNNNPQVAPASSIVAYYGSLIGNVSIPLRVAGPCVILCNLDVAGTDAIGYAYEAVRHGKSRMMLAGGADSPVTPMVETGIEQAGVALRGERKTRLSPGAAILLLEEWNSAQERGARIFAELLGYETSTAASGRDAGKSLLKKMGRGTQLDCVVAAGVAPHETEFLTAMLGETENRPPVTHINGAADFSAAASGGMQALASVMLLGERGAAAGQDPPNGAASGADRSVHTVLQASTGLSRKTSMLLFSRAA